MRVVIYCSKCNIEPWADIMWCFHIKLLKIYLGRLDLLLKQCATYINWVDMEHSKAMSVVSRGRIAVEIAQVFCKKHRSQAVQLALALNTVEIMWKSPSVAAGLHRELRKERQQERLAFRCSSLGQSNWQKRVSLMYSGYEVQVSLLFCLLIRVKLRSALYAHHFSYHRVYQLLQVSLWWFLFVCGTWSQSYVQGCISL